MYDPGIEPELERICLRCLSRPMSERYLTASDLGADLKRVIDGSPPPARAVEPIVYKGLMPFDAEDARFFLALLPGPRRGDGMPESVRFWKDRVEATDGEKAFSVGVLYGPSGGGKSSFLRAGLLPNLDRGRVRPVYLETTPTETETRLLSELRRQVPALPVDVNLPDAVAILRDDTERRSTAKLIIVLDQFEQWLEAHPDQPDAELVRALRQCDGRRVGALVVVRDDFWMAATRFLQAVDVPLVQGGNAAAVKLFDARHTRKVLEGFGRALGQLPEAGGAVTEEAEHFFQEVVSGLTDADGRVVPMRLSLFTEVVRNRPWTPETLRALGGVDGIGVKFLEDCFTKPEYKHYGVPAKKVLAKLLPPPTSAIRGRPCGGSELQAAAGYAQQPGEFAKLVRVLAGELRLVTVAETDGSMAGADPAVPAGKTRYQLAHDFLVRPIRRWLERELRSTRRGRARLRLELVTASWREQPGSRRLPSLLEWAGILRHIPPREWSTDERRLMLAAARYFATRGAPGAGRAGGSGSGIREHPRTRSSPQRGRTGHRGRAGNPAGTLAQDRRAARRFSARRRAGRARHLGHGPAAGQRRPAAPPRATERRTRRNPARPAARGRPGRTRIDPRYARHRPRDGPQRSAHEHLARRLGHGREPASGCVRASWVLRRLVTRTGRRPPAHLSGASSGKIAARTRGGSSYLARRGRLLIRSETSAPTRATTRSCAPPPRRRWPGRSRPSTTRSSSRTRSQAPSPALVDPAPPA